MTEKAPTKASWLYALVYVLLVVGLIPLGIYLNINLGLHPALMLMGIAAASAALASLFHAQLKQRRWQIAAGIEWIAALFLFTLYLGVSGLLHPALLMSLYAFAAAGIVLYVIARKRSADARAINTRSAFEKLGERDRPADRDVKRAA